MRMPAKARLGSGLILLAAQVFGQQVGPQVAQEDLLTATIAQAVATHPKVQSALASRGGSELGYAAARWQYYPSPSVSTERGSSDVQASFGNATTTTLRLQQNIWTGGRISANVNEALNRVRFSDVALLDAKTTVAERTLDAWSVLLVNFGRSRASQKAQERLQGLADMIDRRVERDISANVDKVLIHARLTQLQTDFLAQNSAQESAKQRLGQWVGDARMADRLTGAVLDKVMQTAFEALPDSTISDIVGALDRQPQLQRSAVETALAQDELQRREADAWPTVYVRVDRQFIDADPSYLGTKGADTKLYFGVQYSPGAGLSLSSNVRAAQSKISASQFDRESIRRELQDRAHSAWREHSNNGFRLRQSKESVQASNDVVDAYMRLFVVGKRSWLDVLNAVRELQTAEGVLSDLQAQQVISAYGLKILSGVLDWQNMTASEVFQNQR